MEIVHKIFIMYGIAFCIAMFVALIIWAINKFLTDFKFKRIVPLSSFEELKRLEKIKKIRKQKIYRISKKIERNAHNDIIDFYYGND